MPCQDILPRVLFFARLGSRSLLVLVLSVTLISDDGCILATNISGLGSCSLGNTSGKVTVYNSGDLALLVLLGIWQLTLGNTIILYALYWQPLRIIVSPLLDYALFWVWTCRRPLRFLYSKLAALGDGLYRG